MVLVNHNKLMYVKIQNLDQTQRINYVVCEYDIIENKETIVMSDSNQMEIEEEGARAYAQFAVFSSDLKNND